MSWREYVHDKIKARNLVAGVTLKMLSHGKGRAIVKWREVSSQGNLANRLWQRIKQRYVKEFTFMMGCEILAGCGQWRQSKVLLPVAMTVVFYVGLDL
jgi:hypothetical protein